MTVSPHMWPNKLLLGANSGRVTPPVTLQESFALRRRERARLQQALQHAGKRLPHDRHSLDRRGAATRAARAALAALAVRAPDGLRGT